MSENQQNDERVNDLKAYSKDIIKIENIMIELHALLFYDIFDIIRSRVRLF